MNIQSDVDFISQYVFLPIYAMTGRLLAVELLTRFTGSGDNLAMPTEIGLRLLTPEQRIELFTDQLTLAEKRRQRVQQLPFIAFEINEIFPNLSAGKDNVKIRSLSDYFSLWLDGFGSGKATLTALYDGLFDFVKIDKRFYWQLVTQQGYDLVIDSLLKNINQLCKGVIVCGIEKHEYFNKLTNTGVLGLQGFLWPAISVDNLRSLRRIAEEFDNNS